MINNVNVFGGQHCETTAVGTVLNHIGLEFSEPMLFGLGEGLGFIFWNMKTVDFPFIGGRIKPDGITQNIAKNLNLNLISKESSSPVKAWTMVQKLIDDGQIVGLKLDCYHLEYFSNAFHFAGHYVAIYGYDNDKAYLVDTRQQGGKVSTSLGSLAAARNEKGPMSSKNLFFYFKPAEVPVDLRTAICKAVKNNAIEYLNPPIQNVGYKGIYKTSKEIMKWFQKSQHPQEDFFNMAEMMEKAGTGGALFRNLYRDFLGECKEIVKSDSINSAYVAYVDIASKWSEVISLFYAISRTGSLESVKEAAKLLEVISVNEKLVMEKLVQL